jgi:hypothetical protein
MRMGLRTLKFEAVMAGLVPAMHLASQKPPSGKMDPRVKPGDDRRVVEMPS